MLFLEHGIATVLFIAAIIYCCLLFSNAIEHLGLKLKLGNSATGSILAVIGTCLPETIVPIVAIFASILFKTDLSIGQNVAQGAIIGSPFILSTLALFLMGILLVIKKKVPKELNVNYQNIIREYKYFLIAYIVAFGAIFVNSRFIKILIVCFLIGLYCFFVYRTIVKSKQNFVESDIDTLIFSKIICIKKCCKHYKDECLKCDNIYITLLQIILSLVGLIVFSHLFVNEIKYFSLILNINPLILSLLLAPIATELPEIVNSIIWLKQDKDELAISNVVGAIVFQAMVPCSIGIMLTNWKFDTIALLNMIFVILCGVLFFTICKIQKSIKLLPLLFCGLFYLGFLVLLIF